MLGAGTAACSIYYVRQVSYTRNLLKKYEHYCHTKKTSPSKPNAKETSTISSKSNTKETSTKFNTKKTRTKKGSQAEICRRIRYTGAVTINGRLGSNQPFKNRK